MSPKIENARHLYLNCGLTQREIATQVGISERTLFNWVRQYAWDRLKRAAYQAPAMIAENLCSQLVELQNSIASRETGKRFPTKDEAEITRKLLAGLDKVKKYPSKGQTLQVFTLFRDYLRKSWGKDAARTFGMQMTSFLDNDPVNGYQPFEMEFGADKISPITPFYDDDFDDEDSEDNTCAPSPPCYGEFAEPGGGREGLSEITPAKKAGTIGNTSISPAPPPAGQAEKTGNDSATQNNTAAIQIPMLATPSTHPHQMPQNPPSPALKNSYQQPAITLAKSPQSPNSSGFPHKITLNHYRKKPETNRQSPH